MAKENIKGFADLGKTLKAQMQQEAAQPPVLDFGEIKGDYSLVTNRFPVPIPATDYLVCRSLTIGPLGGWLANTKEGEGLHPHGPSGGHAQYTGSGQHSHPETEGAHLHTVLIPPKLRTVLPGDRVLIAWVENDAVIIDIILPAQGAIV